ncbi:MAG: DUF6252 family protein [Bacteroidetes bacterium]|nr:DUF6252 family protein [Bacteroidota bacterium]
MKSTFALILVTGLIFSAGCKKDSNTNNETASMMCKIDGVAWTSSTRLTTMQAGSFLINATNSHGFETLNIIVSGITKGTYTIDPLSAQIQASASYSNSMLFPDSIYTAFSGTVTLTSVDLSNKKISGSFSFDAKNLSMKVKKITEGVFTGIQYQ